MISSIPYIFTKLFIASDEISFKKKLKFNYNHVCVSDQRRLLKRFT